MSRAPVEPSTRNRVSGLDGLRGLAACTVAFGFHVKYLFAEGVYQPLAGPIGLWMMQFGWTAVDLFFVMSGYVFAHVYLSRPQAMRAPGAMRQFWIARIARLYPLHLATLLFMAIAFRHDPANSIAAFAEHLAMLQVFATPLPVTFNGPSWSISVEMICYAIFAMALRQGRPAVTGAAIACVGTGLVGVTMAGDLTHNTIGGDLSRGLLGFFAGQLLWQARHLTTRIATPLLAGIALLGIGWATMRGPHSTGMVVALTLGAWPALVVLAQRLRAMQGIALSWLGDRSYAIYLLNMPIVLVLQHTTIGLQAGFGSILAAQAGLVVVNLGAADLVYRYFERPARDWLRRALSKPPRVPAVQPA